MSEEGRGRGGLALAGLHKRYASVVAVDGVDLAIERGEFFTLLGPSGCGKTTLLRMVAGFERPDRGQVLLDGADLTALPAHRRPVNTVFQSYALFPHLAVADNVAFGLRSRGVEKSEVGRRVAAALALLRIEPLAARRPHQLSGGQRQRVALARALVNEPDVLLLDEPMSALDAKLRAEVQVELRRLQRRLGTTFILVTHDQDEAMCVSDRLAVMKEGRIVQLGRPEEVYDRPRTRFAAEFLGAANLIAARRHREGADTALGLLRTEAALPWNEGTLAIRPERIRLCATEPSSNAVRCSVREVAYWGDALEAWLEPGGLRVRTAPHPRLAPGQDVWAQLPPEGLVALNEDA